MMVSYKHGELCLLEAHIFGGFTLIRNIENLVHFYKDFRILNISEKGYMPTDA